MIPPDSTPETGSTPPLLPLKAVLHGAGDPTRWLILAELAAGEPLMVKEIAQHLRCSPSLISKHLAVLRKGGLVVTGRAGLYSIPAQYLVSKEKRHVDYGHCLLRLPNSEGQVVI
jgi:DNA-binding transcriptional ArsR family regulator